MAKRSRMPRDFNQRALRTVELSTGQREPDPPAPAKNPAAVELGRLGGQIGGRKRADNMTPEQRSESARKAAVARWSRATSS